MTYATKAEKNAQAAEYRARNREVLRERSRAYRAANPEKVAAGIARWQEEHADSERAKARERYHADPVAHRERQAAWVAANPVRVAAHAAAGGGNSRALRQGVPGRLTADDLEALWLRQPACQSCGVESRGMDHIVAMVNGGPNVPENLQNLCKPCNQEKAKRDLARETCPQGHALTGDNLRVWGGRRVCRTCRNASCRAYDARRRAA